MGLQFQLFMHLKLLRFITVLPICYSYIYLYRSTMPYFYTLALLDNLGLIGFSKFSQFPKGTSMQCNAMPTVSLKNGINTCITITITSKANDLAFYKINSLPEKQRTTVCCCSHSRVLFIRLGSQN
jgi:hypothetical protein